MEVILQPTDNGNIKMKLLEINPPNADHKNTGTLYMLEKAIEHFGPELAKQLGPDVKNLRLFIQTEDFPTQTEWEVCESESSLRSPTEREARLS